MEERFPGRPVVRDGERLVEAERELREYFAGERSSFDLPVDLSSLSPFDRRVLEVAFRTIRFGEVVPYAELAKRIGKPKAARAVGGALGRNPVAIVVPCHRVVRSDGSLGGYGGGVRYKERLLEIEGRRDLLRAS
jgi:methylated-DNA-[protein]-cysteine S-methyltransferase